MRGLQLKVLAQLWKVERSSESSRTMDESLACRAAVGTSLRGNEGESIRGGGIDKAQGNGRVGLRAREQADLRREERKSWEDGVGGEGRSRGADEGASRVDAASASSFDLPSSLDRR